MKGRRARSSERLLELDEVERRLRPFGRRYLGVRAIPLDALVGTDGRASSFTRDFRPLHAFSRDRLRSLKAAFADGGFPPIVTVKLGEAYFVIDGHHRAAFARRGGAEMIDADVTELIARVGLPAGRRCSTSSCESSSGSSSRTAVSPRLAPASAFRSAGPRSTSSCWRTFRCTATT